MKFKLYDISKIIFVIYLVYTNVTINTWFFVPLLSPMLIYGALCLAVVEAKSKLMINIEVAAYWLFAAYALISGALFAIDRNVVFNSLYTFVEYTIVIYLICYYAKCDKSINFVLHAFIIQAMFATYFLVFRGTGINRISIAENVNDNTISIMLSFAIGYLLFMLLRSRKASTIRISITVASILVMLFGIILTVSKKGIISSLVLILLWLVFAFRSYFSKMNIFLKIAILLGILFAVIKGYNWYVNNYSQQFAFVMYRMSQISEGTSTVARKQLIKDGFMIFMEHPFFGVGYNNARYYTSLLKYTHCFYAELLACTGIFGALIFGYAFFMPIKELLKSFADLKNNEKRVEITYMLCIHAVLLFIGFTQIFFYSFTLMFQIGVLIAYSYELSGKGQNVMREERE